MPSRSVLTTVIAFGAASSALAIPLPSSSALDGTVSFSTIPALAPTTINSRELELSVFDGNEWHPLAHYAGELDKQHIDAVAQLLEKENVVVPLPSPKPDVSAQLVPVPIPVDVTPVSEQLANVVFDEHTESPFPLLDPTVVLPKVESESLTLTLDVASPAPGLSPLRIERPQWQTKRSQTTCLNCPSPTA